MKKNRFYILNVSNKDNIYEYNGFIGFFCKRCFKVNIIKVSNLREDYRSNKGFYIDFNYRFNCSDCNYENIFNGFIDPNIVKYIAMLNKKNYITRCCCEGHKNDNSESYILFEKRYEIIENNNIPNLWTKDVDSYYIDSNYENIKSSCIRCNERYPLKIRMRMLYNWIKELPYAKE